MTETIKLSLMNIRSLGIEDIDAALQKQSNEVKEWLAQEARIKSFDGRPLPPMPTWENYRGYDNPQAAFEEDMKKWEADRDSRPTKYPFPESGPVQKALVDPETGDIRPYEVVDDTPKPEQILAMKKNALFARLAEVEAQEQQKAFPLAKRRLAEILAREVMERDQNRVNDAVALLNKETANGEKLTRTAADISSPEFTKNGRNEADRAFADDYEIKTAKIKRIERWIAEVQCDIEDLTLDTIDAWVMPAYSEI